MTSENRGYRNVGNFEDKSKNYFRKTEGNGRYRDSADNSGKFHPVFGVCIVWIEWKCVDKSY